jgi:hypothetical protein
MVFMLWFKEFFDALSRSIVLSFFDMLKDLFYWMFETILDLSILGLEGTGELFEGINIVNYIDAVPPEVGWVMNQIGLGQAVGIILVAIPIRIALQLIPFTRLGS